MQTTLGRRVQWQENGAWQVGNLLECDYGEIVTRRRSSGWLMDGTPVVEYLEARRVLVLPQHARLPVFVRADLLVEAPSHETLEAAK